MNVPMWIAIPVVATTAAATVVDARVRRIPNLLTISALLAAGVAHFVMRGGAGLSDAALGALIAGGILLPGWLMGWMGAGDVKLMAAIGAWLGSTQGLFAALAALMAGGVVAVVVALRSRMLMRALWGATVLASWSMTQGMRSPQPPVMTGVRFPFAVAVMAGALTSLWVRI